MGPRGKQAVVQTVFGGKGNVFRRRKSDKLTVRILQYGSHFFGYGGNIHRPGIFPQNGKRAACRAGKGVGNKSVYAVDHGGFSGPGRSRYEDLLAGIY